MTTDPATGLVPVATVRTEDDLPADLASPSTSWRASDIAGVVTGGLLLILTAALFGYAMFVG